MQGLFVFALLILFLGRASILEAQTSAFTDLKPLLHYIKERVQTSSEFEKHWNKGMAFFRKGDYVAAGESFGGASLESPTHSLAQLYLSLCLMALEKYDLSSEILERAIYFYPPFFSLKLNLRELYEVPEDFDQQFHHLKQELAQNPNALEAKFLLAFCFYYTGNTSQARLLYQELLETKRYTSWARYFLKGLGTVEKTERPLFQEAQELFRQETYLEACDKFIQAHLAEPDQAFFVFQISLCLFATQRFEASAEFLKKAIALDPAWYELQLEAASHYKNPELHVSHLDQLREYLSKNPTKASLSLLLGFHLFFSQNTEDALTALRYAQSLEPQNPTILQVLEYAQTHQAPSQKKPPPTLPSTKTLPEPEPSPEKSKTSLSWGESAFRARDYKKASKSCIMACEEDPKNPTLRYYYALTLFATQHYNYSAQALAEALRQNFLTFTPWKSFYNEATDFQAHHQAFLQNLQKKSEDSDLRLLQAVLFIQEEQIQPARLELYKLLESPYHDIAKTLLRHLK